MLDRNEMTLDVYKFIMVERYRRKHSNFQIEITEHGEYAINNDRDEGDKRNVTLYYEKKDKEGPVSAAITESD